MNIKIAAALTLGIVVLAGGALFFWPDLDNEPEASAQAAVGSACTNMDKVESYDILTTTKITGDNAPLGNVTIKARVSGDNYHAEFSAPGYEADEYIRVGGDSYERVAAYGTGWALSSASFRDIDSNLGILGDSPICPDLTQVLRKGEEELNGIKVTRYTSGDTSGSEKAALDALDETFEGSKVVDLHDYWIDASGQLVQHRHEYYSLSQYRGDRQANNVVMLSTFSEVGLPNTITAPTLGE